MIVKNGEDYLPQVKELILEYVYRLDRDLSFQGLDKELAHMDKYLPPNGELLVALDNEKVIGMVAYFKHDEKTCELKRLYVKPEARGLHLGDVLVSKLINHAKDNGFEVMYLDTIKPLKAAISLYEKHGFEECEPYYNNPMDDVIYMKKDLI